FSCSNPSRRARATFASSSTTRMRNWCLSAFISFSSSRATFSPDQLQSKLNLPRWCLGRSNQPCVGDYMTAGVEDISIVERRSKVRPVDHVEKFGSKLNIE